MLDDIERLLEFVHIGPRFSNAILQALVVLLKKKPPHEDRKLLIIGTTSMRRILGDLEVINCFNTTLRVPNVLGGAALAAILNNFNCTSHEIQAIAQEYDAKYAIGGVPVKKVLLAVELAIERSGTGELKRGHFMDCLQSVKTDDDDE